MPRPRKKRCCRKYLADRVYKPQGMPMKEMESAIISLDEFEALRLCDLENHDQEEAGKMMNVSRGTIQRMLYKARRQIIDAIINNKAIVINLKESEESHVGLHTNQKQHRGRRYCE